MAIEKKRMQQRYGTYDQFQKENLLPHEFASVTSGDPNTSDGKGLYFGYGSGDVKRIAFSDEINNGGGSGDGDGTGGTTNYNNLSNLPQINGITLAGNKTSSDLNLQPAGNYLTQETDPTVPAWAKELTKPTYTADEVGALPVGTKIPAKTSDLTNDSGYLTQIPEEYVTETELGQKGYITEDDIPDKLPSPGTLTFTGVVNDTYDGSTDKTINIPTGGGEGGTSDYNALANKPKLNGVEIVGNKTSADYKIVSSEQGAENNGKFLGVGADGNVTPVDKPIYTANEVGARPNTWTPSAEDVGALPNDTEIPSKTSDLENDSGFITSDDIPEKLPNPQKIIFTGAVTAEYDGSSQQTINIPTGGGSNPYTLPIMSSAQLGGGKAVEKTDEDVPVAVDPGTGQLFVPTYPESASANIPRQEMQNTDTTVTLEPNKLYIFPEMASLTVTLAEPDNSNVANEYHFFFTSGTTATTLTLNDVLSDAYSIEANMKYEVSILENVAYIKGVAISAA